MNVKVNGSLVASGWLAPALRRSGSTDSLSYGGQAAYFAKAWPPKTCPRPSDLVAPRWINVPLTRGDSKARERGPTENGNEMAPNIGSHFP